VASIALLLSQLERARNSQILTSSRDINRATLRCGPRYGYVYVADSAERTSAYERHAHERHAHERHAHERHAHERHDYEKHTHVTIGTLVRDKPMRGMLMKRRIILGGDAAS
jgi:hypothetical protein